MNENVSIDNYLESNQTNLIAVDASYTGYEFEKVTSSTAPQNWNGGVRAEFSFPQYEDSVWDTESMYIDCVCELKITDNDKANPGFLSPYATAAAEQFFTSGLVEYAQVNYGGIDLQNVQAPTNIYPYLSAVYTLVNNKSVHTGGCARVLNFLSVDGGLKEKEYNERTSNASDQFRVNDVTKDASDPYNMSIDNGYQYEPHNEKQQYMTVFIADPISGGIYNSRFTSSYVYRNMLVTSDEEVPGNAATRCTGYKIRFLMKLKDGFLNNPYKKPANIPLKISLTRNRSILYSICGNAIRDAELSRIDNAANSPEYIFTFDRMDMYCKRLFLSANQLSIYRSNPLLMYDIPRWSAQVFSLTSNSINLNTNWTKKPEVLYAAIVPTDSINGTVNGAIPVALKKFYSCYSSSDRRLIDFEELAINTSIGQIPKEKYQLRDTANNRHSLAGVQRAYEDFKKSCANPDSCITFNQWFNNMRIYGFIINSDQHNPHTQNSHPSRSTINVVATLYNDGAVALSGYSLVLVGMYYARLGVAEMKSVFITT